MSTSLFHTLNISRQDMVTRLADLDVISNNLANVNTAGYKASRSNFQELLENANKEGVFTPSTQLLTNQGGLNSSESSLDWAIQGEGFFPINLPNGQTGYTRDGQFSLDAERQLVNASGYTLDWDGEIPEDYVSISLKENGAVEVVNSAGEISTVGQVQLAQFINPTALISNGGNIYLPSVSSGQATLGTPGTNNLGITASGMVEKSNVSLSREMTQLINDQRAFQLSTKAFQQTDTMIQQAISLRK